MSNRTQPGSVNLLTPFTALNDIHAEVLRLNTKLGDSDVKSDAKKKYQEELEKAETTIKRFGDRAGDFSIQRLFLDLATADISSLPASEISLGSMTPVQVTTFSVLLQQWLTENKSSGHTTLGYGLSIDKDKAKSYKVADILMPTWVEMQTYPYKASATDQPILGWTGDAARNCLTYCNMTENRLVSGERLLAWSGNFTTIDRDKERRVDGSAVIRRALFLDKFVLPMLHQYNDDMQIVASSMELLRDGPAGQRRFHWKYASFLGKNPQHTQYTDSYYNFRENQKDANLNQTTGRLFYEEARSRGYLGISHADGVSWSWSQNCDTGEKKEADDWTSPISWQDHFSGRNTSFSAVDIVPIPGQGRIRIQGYSEAKVTYGGEYTRLIQANLVYDGKITYVVYWQVDIVLESTQDKGITTKFENQHVFSFEDIRETGNNDGTSAISFVDTLKNNVEGMLNKKESIYKAINDSLVATGKFTHPAAGEFNLKDPMFNRQGDLLMTAQYIAPKKGSLQFSMPAIGAEVKQRDPTVDNSVKAVGDAIAELGKKGGK
ncbi:hypothetical protein CGLO_17533 [Colletotrichum gloeosporioides Cg-14]|uniref:Uncharacterized protein n=1 Tax=Colletotrichum gloeosporioides (strain Cg-14) TaxID=1237896 RepID=T0L662_COLGC|nr:hypothetical protein CGLO_17533 [Colletotrichum gloeosporioides Cg-14]